MGGKEVTVDITPEKSELCEKEICTQEKRERIWAKGI